MTSCHCLVPNREGLGTSRFISGKQHETHIVRKKHIEISNVLKFGVNRAYIERDTAIQKLQNLLRNNRQCVQQSIHLLI